MNRKETDEKYMRMAIELAKLGAGHNSPNPFVGAVVVKDGRVIGRGYHARYGELHAERNALADCSEDPSGATIYVTLEPCCHHGKTPPCTEAIMERGLSRVVMGSDDPNPLVAGQGAEILRNAGIEVTAGVLKEECDALNTAFFHHISTGLPYVTMKYAMTSDGKIATVSGKSKWISGPASRKRVHSDRALNMGIMVGIGTVLADDPELTVREAEGLDPIRIICDSSLRTPLGSKVMQGLVSKPSGNEKYTFADEKSRYPRTIIATCVSDEAKLLPYRELGAEIVTVGRDEDGHIDLRELMNILGSRGVNSIMLEGGGTLNWSALKSGIVSRVQCYMAPKLFGGLSAKSPVAGTGVDSPADAFMLRTLSAEKIGDDLLIESEVICSQE